MKNNVVITELSAYLPFLGAVVGRLREDPNDQPFPEELLQISFVNDNALPGPCEKDPAHRLAIEHPMITKISGHPRKAPSYFYQRIFAVTERREDPSRERTGIVNELGANERNLLDLSLPDVRWIGKSVAEYLRDPFLPPPDYFVVCERGFIADMSRTFFDRPYLTLQVYNAAVGASGASIPEASRLKMAIG